MKATLAKANITAAKNIANNKHNALGFSFIEIIVVIFILAISYSSVMYFYTNNKNRNQAKIIINQIKDSLIYAKYYAIKNKTEVFICPSSNMLNCEQDWGQGYIVYFNKDKINSTSKSININIIKSHKFSKNLNKFSINLFMFGNSSINYNNILAISKYGTTFNNGHFLYIDNRNTKHLYWNNQLRFYTK